MAVKKLSRPRVSGLLGVAGVAAAGLLSTACAGTATNATSPASATKAVANVTPARAHTPAWRDVVTVNNGTSQTGFETVLATGKTTGWAFLPSGSYAYQRTGPASWKKVALPGKNGNVSAAAASSPSNVWISYYTSHGSQLDRWTGSRWQAVKTLPGAVNGLEVLGTSDVWAFGGVNADTGGIWHYNGRSWTLVSRTLRGGSAVSDKNVWAFAGQTIAHYDGKTWTSTNVAKLLPPKPPYGSVGVSQVHGVTALSAKDVYAVGVGVDQPMGGPLVLLHYNGRSWSKVAGGDFTGGTQQIASDGKGGVWIAAAGTDRNPDLLHYSAGKLIQAETTLPGAPRKYTEVFSVSRIPGTAGELAAGTESVPGAATSASVILEYS